RDLILQLSKSSIYSTKPLLGYGEDLSNRAREITHTICYANGHTNQPFFGVIHAVSTTDA
ncbi:hypothetical protein WJE63_005125, partial [Klebsiella pneumoniae]|nr:hypothetical protein [Klebsiella pneumoniae]